MTTRTYMTEKVWIGTRWRRRRDDSVWKVRQAWRKERRALLVREGSLIDERITVTFDVLRDTFEEVE